MNRNLSGHWRNHMRIVGVLIGCLLMTAPAWGDPVDLDLTFSGTGKVTTAVLNGSAANAQAVPVQSDGKIVVAGDAYTGRTNDITQVSPSDFAVVRYATDGSLDPTFGNGGKVTVQVDDTIALVRGRAVALQSDG